MPNQFPELSAAKIAKIRDVLDIALPQGWTVMAFICPTSHRFSLQEIITVTTMTADEMKILMKALVASDSTFVWDPPPDELRNS